MKRFFRRRVLLGGSVGAAILAIALLGAGWWRAQGPAGSDFKGALGPFVVHATPAPVPELALAGGDGKALTLADFKGKVVLLNLWATWCGPCVEEMPALDRLQARLGGPDFTVIALSVDRQGRSLVEPFLEKLAVKNLAMYLDTGNTAMRALKVRGLPTTLLLDRDGREIGRMEGAAAWDSPAAEALLRRYRDGKGKTS
jgi:thiol-disulfide isomerase/thioredoxin